MKKDNAIINEIKHQGMIPLFYYPGLAESKAVIQSLYDAGIRIIEYTNRGHNALDNFQELVNLREKQWPGLLLAAGTIRDLKDCKNFCKAGADIIICPGTIKEVARKAKEAGILWIPGCLSTTDIMHAEKYGARMMKIFPGSLLGPAYITAIKEIFPHLDFMPTGGVDTTRENIESWFKAGVAAIGLGSKLISKELLVKKDYPAITSKCREVLGIINSINNPS